MDIDYSFINHEVAREVARAVQSREHEMARELLQALNRFDGAQPFSPAAIWHQALTEVRALKAKAPDA